MDKRMGCGIKEAVMNFEETGKRAEELFNSGMF